MTSLGQHAEENLQFIRRTMERSSTFTAVPGLGGAGMGAIGLAAAVLAVNQGSADRWRVVWLLAAAVGLGLYGTGVLAGGVFSVAAVRLLGVAFMALGIAALVTPPTWGNVWLGMGFGGLQLVFGLYIAGRHGG